MTIPTTYCQHDRVVASVSVAMLPGAWTYVKLYGSERANHFYRTTILPIYVEHGSLCALRRFFILRINVFSTSMVSFMSKVHNVLRIILDFISINVSVSAFTLPHLHDIFTTFLSCLSKINTNQLSKPATFTITFKQIPSSKLQCLITTYAR